MRKIRFRGYDLKAKAWVYGDLVHDQITLPDGNEKKITAILDDSGTVLEVEPESVGQFTGYHDYYKEDIYEGDVLTNGDHDEFWTVRWDEEGYWSGEGDSIVEELFGILMNEPWPEVIETEWERRRTWKKH